MAKSVLLSDAIDEYLGLLTLAQTKGTVAGNRTTLKALLREVGNIYTKNLDPRHGDKMLAVFSETRGPGAIQTAFSHLRGFSSFLRQRLYLAFNHEPFGNRLPARVEQQKLQIPETQFSELLDAAVHPVERMVIAMGLFLFLRQSEIKLVRLQDVDLEAGRIEVTVVKSKIVDSMPISEELDREIRRWMLWYEQNTPRDLRPTDHLCSGRTAARFFGHPTGEYGSNWAIHLRPEKPINRPERYIHKALEILGYATRDTDGKSLSEGVHTLRRSGARALYDKLIGEGYDGAIRTVQAMLHHKSVQTTEIYLGINLDKKRRDDLIRGRSMYGAVEAATPLRLVSGEGHR